MEDCWVTWLIVLFLILMWHLCNLDKTHLQTNISWSYDFWKAFTTWDWNESRLNLISFQTKSLYGRGVEKKQSVFIQMLTLHKKMKFSIKDFFSKCDQIRKKLRIWLHLPKESLMENFIFCVVSFMNAQKCFG